MSNHRSRIQRRGSALAVTLVSLVALALLAPPAAASPQWSDWSAPVWLGATINSSAEDAGPAVSKDGLAFYFYSTRAGGVGGEDIYVSYRASTHAPWGTPVNLGTPINTTANERVPAFSRDGHWMFFASNRTGAKEIWTAKADGSRQTQLTFFNGPAVGSPRWSPDGRQITFDGYASGSSDIYLVPADGGKSAFGEAGPSYFQDDAGTAFLYFNSNKPGGLGSADIYVAVQQPDGSFGAVANVTRLNSPFFDARATISHDGLEVIFNSNRATGSLLGQVDLWSATRESTSGAWSTPTSLTALKTAASDYTPYLSADRETLYFASDRAGGLGAGDLWVSTRTKSSGKP